MKELTQKAYLKIIWKVIPTLKVKVFAVMKIIMTDCSIKAI
jgi:hypothetical protein